jgi:very-short-patch-repair endonuclease
MMEEYNPTNITNARQLRRKATDAERLLWKHLRMRQLGAYKFRRQQPIGPYIVDFICFEQNLIIELDGGQHADQVQYDEARSVWLKERGYG